MAKVARRLAALIAAVVTAGVLNPGTAAAITDVPCFSRDLVILKMHYSGDSDSKYYCYINKGEVRWGDGWWVDSIWTGDNIVQWHGDGRWQPAKPLGKWTTMRWPNHPGGVRMDGLRIL